MAGLNLIPNPGVIAVVAVFFLAAVKIVKTYFLQPFKKLQTQRENMTTGGHEEAVKRLERAKVEQIELNKKLSLARDEAQAKKNIVIEETNRQAKAILEKIKNQADTDISAARITISEIIKNESEKVIPLVDRLAEELYGTLTR